MSVPVEAPSEAEQQKISVRLLKYRVFQNELYNGIPNFTV
jgi:hypothetical protein